MLVFWISTWTLLRAIVGFHIAFAALATVVFAARSSIAVDTLTIHVKPDGLFLITVKTLKRVCNHVCVYASSE